MSPDDLARLVDAHAPALVLFARQWCSAPEDVVQEAFCKLAACRSGPADPVAWLYAVVRNAARMAARADRRRRAHEAAARGPSWFHPAEGTRLDAASVTAALHELPVELRETVVAHLWGGLTFGQVGALTGVSSSTAHRRYHDALACLRDRLRVPAQEPEA